MAFNYSEAPATPLHPSERQARSEMLALIAVDFNRNFDARKDAFRPEDVALARQVLDEVKAEGINTIDVGAYPRFDRATAQRIILSMVNAEVAKRVISLEQLDRFHSYGFFDAGYEPSWQNARAGVEKRLSGK